MFWNVDGCNQACGNWEKDSISCWLSNLGHFDILRQSDFWRKNKKRLFSRMFFPEIVWISTEKDLEEIK